ncbi:DEAD-domain-containing protein [Phlegmacium glaucopus]|nr:DEAD-domain-containing protein [Phlegmacium glaucopus]
MPPRNLPGEDSDDDDIQIESDWGQVNDNFDKIGLKKNLLKGKPSPVQQCAIMPLLHGRNLIMQAQSGIGKTAAFVIGNLQKVGVWTESVNATQAPTLAPSRELSQQTQKVVLAIGKYMNIRCYDCIGGRKVSGDVKKLEKGVHVVVGTPGRLLDLIKRELVTDKIKMLCLDEADEMFSRGFKKQIVKATAKILVKKQFFIIMEKPNWKLDTLCDLYTTETFTHPTVVDALVVQLEERELPALATHRKKLQKDREAHLQDFRTGASRVLITTDMLARGIDVQQVAVVINYDLPESKEMYMHRIGRIAINFVTKEEISKIREIEQYYSTQIEEMPLEIS